MASIDPEAAQIVAREGPIIGGGYNDGDMSFTLDGGYTKGSDMDKPFGKTQTARDLYAHEFTHAIDGREHTLSRNEEWFDAANADLFETDETGRIVGARLTNYAIEGGPIEGLAEFGRLLYCGKFQLPDIEREFPRCSAYFKKIGLWPAGVR
jgi:hypothetical protein